MTFPTFEEVTQTQMDYSGTSIDVNMPATVNANDLLVMIVAASYLTGFIWDTPSGWTKVASRQSAYACPIAVYAKKADGTEDGGTVNVTWGGANVYRAAHVYRIRQGTWGTGTVASDITATGRGDSTADTNWDPPSHASGFGAVDTFWIAAVAGKGGSATSAPTSFSGLVNNSDIFNTYCTLASAYRSVNTSVLNPSAFSAPSSTDQSYTIAIKPPTATSTIVTPGVASLATTGYAPKLIGKINAAAPPALTTTGYAAKLLGVVKTATPTALVTTGQAPKLAETIPMAAPTALALTGQAPSLALAVKPDAAALVTTGYEPNIAVDKFFVPDPASLVATGYAPKLIYVITPDVAAALTLAGLAPDVNIARVVTPDTAALTTALYASTLLLTINLPSPAALATTGYAPALALTLTPSPAALATAMFAPSLIYVLTPGVLALTTSLLTPTVFRVKYIKPDTAALTTSLYTPSLPLVPSVLALELTTYEPEIAIVWRADANTGHRLMFGASRVNVLPSGIAVVQWHGFGSSRVAGARPGVSRIARLPFGSSSTQKRNDGTRG